VPQTSAFLYLLRLQCSTRAPLQAAPASHFARSCGSSKPACSRTRGPCSTGALACGGSCQSEQTLTACLNCSAKSSRRCTSTTSNSRISVAGSQIQRGALSMLGHAVLRNALACCAVLCYAAPCRHLYLSKLGLQAGVTPGVHRPPLSPSPQHGRMQRAPLSQQRPSLSSIKGHSPGPHPRREDPPCSPPAPSSLHAPHRSPPARSFRALPCSN
jgi:hypothetical protein